MYLILSLDQLKIVARVSTAEQAVLIGELDCPDQAVAIFPAGEKKHFTRCGRLDLMILLKNHEIVPAGVEQFAKMCEQASALGETIPVDKRSLFQLEQKAGPKQLPGDKRAIERKPFYQPLSKPCEGADRPAKPERQQEADASPRAAPSKGATAKVWEIADSLRTAWVASPDSHNIKALRTLVVAACEAEGLNPGTAATQFGKWKTIRGL